MGEGVRAAARKTQGREARGETAFPIQSPRQTRTSRYGRASRADSLTLAAHRQTRRAALELFKSLPASEQQALLDGESSDSNSKGKEKAQGDSAAGKAPKAKKKEQTEEEKKAAEVGITLLRLEAGASDAVLTACLCLRCTGESRRACRS